VVVKLILYLQFCQIGDNMFNVRRLFFGGMTDGKRFPAIGAMRGGRMPVRDNVTGLCGHVDQERVLVYEPCWNWAGEFFHKRALVCDSEEYTYIDLDGDNVTGGQFYFNAKKPAHGYGTVLKDGGWQHITLSVGPAGGRPLYLRHFRDANPFERIVIQGKSLLVADVSNGGPRFKIGVDGAQLRPRLVR
jgi:hypothetical protein